MQSVDLNHSPQGFEGIILRIDGGPSLQRKLMSLGLRKGQSLRILQHRGKGVVVASQGSRIALGPDVAAHIFVSQSKPTVHPSHSAGSPE